MKNGFDAQRYIELWASAEEGSSRHPPHSIYQYITAMYPQMGKSNAALYQSIRVLEELHGWKLDLDNVVWDVPDFLERRKMMRRWDHLIPDEMQEQAGNRTWQTEDNEIVGQELETGSFEHKHVIMTIPSKHRLDKLIADVCTSQMVVDRTDVHHQTSYVTIYGLARGQLDRSSKEFTPKLGTLTLGRTPSDIWAEYLKRKKAKFDQGREINLSKAKALQKEASIIRTSIDADMIESLIFANESRAKSDTNSTRFSLNKVMTLLKDEGYGDVPYGRVQRGTAQANEHRKLKTQLEKAEQAA